jgi:protein MpaA
MLLPTACLAILLPLLVSQTEPAKPDSSPSVASNSWRVCIRPYNYDDADPWEYTRRKGEPDAGKSAAGPTWNQSPIFAAAGDAPAPPIGLAGTAPRIEVLGYSVRGVPIVMQIFGRSGEVTLVFGGIHGNEGNSAIVARRFAEHLEQHPELTRDCRVAVIAAMNPDGLARDSRTNVHGVDLNRNLPAKNWQPSKPGATFGGDQPASEPETEALIRAVDLLQPAAIVSIHSITRGRQCNNFDGPGEALARRMAEKNGYPVRKSIGYPTPGSFGSWAGIDRQLPMITLELPHDQDGESAWSDNRTALLELLRGDDRIPAEAK